MNDKKKIIISDRYSALGVPYPDLETMCKGRCEGLGVYPEVNTDLDSTEETKFVKCEDCNGTGKRI